MGVNLKGIRREIQFKTKDKSQRKYQFNYDQ